MAIWLDPFLSFFFSSQTHTFVVSFSCQGTGKKINMMSSFSYFGGFGLGRFSLPLFFFFVFLGGGFRRTAVYGFSYPLLFLFLMIGVYLEDIYTHSLGTGDTLEGLHWEGN
jgi:hypothetical protein